MLKPIQSFLKGTGEMKSLLRQKNWSESRLGPIDRWPTPLQTALGIALSSKFPMVLWWGSDFLMLYNDAWRPILGKTKHPQFLGEPGEHAWPEIWDVIGPMLQGVMETGVATWVDDQLLVVNRHNYMEEAYFTYSYSPIHMEDGSVGGVFSAVHETTDQVISNRRMNLLRELAAQVTDVDPVDKTIAKVIAVLRTGARDVPFAAIYLAEHDGEVLKGSTDDDAQSELAPYVVPTNLSAPHHHQSIHVSDLGIISPAWQDVINEVIVLPLAVSDQSKTLGRLLIALNPRREYDDSYARFLQLLAQQIASAISSSQSYEQEVRKSEELQAIDRAKTIFFSNVSHEFRTPLTLILSPVESAMETGSSIGAGELEMVAKNSHRLLKLVNNLLDFSRIEAGRYTANFTPRTSLSSLQILQALSGLPLNRRVWNTSLIARNNMLKLISTTTCGRRLFSI